MVFLTKIINFAYILRFTMDNELLKRVLTENSRIIIPGFGVFLRKEQNGTLVFNPFLRRDDGKLSAILELEYGVSAEDAKVMIDEFSDRIRTVLKVKSKYYIDGFGELVVDNNGVVSFVAQVDKPEPVVAPVQPRPISQPIKPQPISRPEAPFEQPEPKSQAGQNPQMGDVFSSRAANPPQPIAQQYVAPKVVVPPPSQPQAQSQPQAPIQPKAQFAPAQPKPLVTPTPQPQVSSPFSRPAPVAQPLSRPTANTATSATVPPPVGAPKQAPQPVNGGAPRPQMPRPANGVPSPRRAAPRSPRPMPKSKKSDMWLVIAIIAAAVVIVLMVIGIINSSQLAEINLQ